MTVTIDEKEYKAIFQTIGNEVSVIVIDYPFQKVYGRGATERERISNAKSNFKLQVETAKDVEVTWG